MTCSCRRSWLGQALFLGLALLATGSAHAVPPEKLLPDNTTMIFGFNMKSFVESPLFQKGMKAKLEELMQKNKEFAGVMQSMNFDPMKDIHSITFAIGNFNLNMQGGPPRPDVEPIIIVKGNFDQAKMDTAAQALISAGGKDKVAVSKMGDRTVYEFKEGDKPMFGTIADKETMLAADSKAALEAMLDRMAGKATPKLSKEFAAAMDKVDMKRTFFMAGILPDSIKQVASMSPQGAVAEKIEAINFTVNVKDNLDIEMNAYTTDADAAKEFKAMLDQAKEMMGILALNAPEEADSKDLSDFLSSIRISNSDKTVSMKGELKGSLIERAIQKAGKGDGN